MWNTHSVARKNTLIYHFRKDYWGASSRINVELIAFNATLIYIPTRLPLNWIRFCLLLIPPTPILSRSEWTQWRDTNSVTFNQERTLYRIMNWINTCISYFQNKTSAPSPSNRLRQCIYFLNQLGKRRAGGQGGRGSVATRYWGIFAGGSRLYFSQSPASGMLCRALWQRFLEAQREATALTTGGVSLWDRGGPQAHLQGFASRIRMVWKLWKWQEK